MNSGTKWNVDSFLRGGSTGNSYWPSATYKIYVLKGNITGFYATADRDEKYCDKNVVYTCYDVPYHDGCSVDLVKYE